ncbi:MAG: EVE domain-containing protein [Saprospiraceae bacterium]|nr:EVE domain-containing protein [Saprospiraceae bacterium]
MGYWLVKSEPAEYSYDDLVAEGVGMWDGVRNYAARKDLRGMEVGDYVLFYHSRQGLEIVGIAEVMRAAYPDPTAEKGDWSAVDLKAIKKFEKSVSLKEIKTVPALQNLGLVRIGRLSVMPVDPADFNLLLQMGETTHP